MRTNRLNRPRDRQAFLRDPGQQYRNGRPLGAAKRAQDAHLSKQARTSVRNARLPYIPPEDWHEPAEDGRDYRVIVQPAGEGYRHVLTPEDVRQRLSLLPAELTAGLEVVQFSRITRKKQSFPCYGLQWGAAIYLYPIEANLVERYNSPPKPSQLIEARLFGGQWVERERDEWRLIWTEEAIRDFYLHNVLIHELGHLVDSRNRSYVDRERYAEWFASHHGYPLSRAAARRSPALARRRHHAKAG